MLTTCLAFMGLFYAAIAPDIQRVKGTNWKKPDWIEREDLWAEGTWKDKEGNVHHLGEDDGGHH